MENMSSKYDFSLLPPHIIAQILKNLNFKERLNAASVCKSWYYASCDPSITQSIRVRIQNDIEWIDDFNRPFNSLVFYQTNFDNFNYQSFLKKFGQNIKFLEFNICKIIIRQLIDCLILLPNLSTLKIITNRTFVREVNTVEGDITILAKNLISIKNFHVCLDASDAGGLAFLLDMMPNLKSINFTTTSSNGYIYDTFFNYINEFADVNLDEVNLGRAFSHRNSFHYDFFDKFAQCKPNLNIRSLTLDGVGISGNNFEGFCKKLSDLQTFSMKCSKIAPFDMISRYMTKLTKLELNGLTCFEFQNVRPLQQLEKLTLQYYTSTRDREHQVDHLAELFIKLNNLSDLHINGVVTKNVLLSLCQNCMNLTSLELSDVDVNVNNLSPIFQYLRNLKRLKLKFFNRIKSNADDYDITNLQLLEHLTISGFVPGMTSELIKQLPKLKEEKIYQTGFRRSCIRF